MSSSIAFVLNGKQVEIDGDHVDLNGTTVSQWLRQHGHVGTKEGCAEGDCGACTVLVSMTDATQSPVWRSMCACIALVPQLDGRSVVTAEGLAVDGQAHPVQTAMVQAYGSQCGYCTPGFVCSMAEGYARPTLRSDDSAGIADQLSGNLCRCTGYRPIREAMASALHDRDHHPNTEAELVRIGTPRSTPHASDIRGTSTFLAPTTSAELLRLRALHSEAVVVGGATELGVWLRKRQQRSAVLLSTDRVVSLQSCHVTAGVLHIGGATTLTQLEEVLAAQPAFAALSRMLSVFASRQTRNRATIAGNLVTASPIGDLAPVLLALDATVTLSSVRGHRTLPLSTFFTGYRTTIMAADELMTAVTVPAPTGVCSSWKVSKRREMDISTVSASFHWVLDGELVTSARLAFGGVAATPTRVLAAEAALVGARVGDASVIDRIDEVLQRELSPLDDFRGAAAYRRSLLRGLFAKGWRGDRSEPQDGPLVANIHIDNKRVSDPSRGLDHESGHLHANGGARYVDDIAARRNCLEMWPVRSTLAHGRIKAIDIATARTMPGVHTILTASDIPGDNNVGPIRHDEPLLPADEVVFFGQVVAMVVAETVHQAQRAAAAVLVHCEPLTAILSIDAARKAHSFHTGPAIDSKDQPHTMRKGDVTAALRSAAHTRTGSVAIGGQEHFYLESQAAMADVSESGDIQVWSSTQHPSEVQATVAHVLHVPRHRVVVTAPRMGGGFGGKETQAAPWAALCALASLQLHDRGIHRAVRMQLDRDIDMEVTGKRHPFIAEYEVGFESDGTITALRCQLFSDGGHALDLSESIHDRAMFHLDNCYNVANMEVTGRVCKTNVVSHTAFRGFGGPQGVLVIEDVIAVVAAATGLDGGVVRERNFYPPTGASTHYGQPVDDFRVGSMWQELRRTADVDLRQQAIEVFNDHHDHVKRGLAMTPVKFGISFTASFLNQAGAWVLIYRDGSIQVNHGGTEMGQGLHTKMMGVVMRELGVSSTSVRMMTTATDKVPNTSATAASSGADLNGAAVLAAVVELRTRLAPVAASMLEAKLGRFVAAHDVRFGDDQVCLPGRGSPSLSFASVVEAAYLRGISLAADGFYRTPDIFYDRVRADGKPFHYFAYGVCCAEVELDGHTGMKRVRRVDILHDVGDSLHPHIDRGQVEGAFVQGMGWLTAEEIRWRGDGRLLTHSASTYAIPTIGDAPADLRVALWADHASQPGVVHGSKAVGEPPLMLAIAVREALRSAVAAFGGNTELPSPMTHEVLRMAVAEAMRSRGA
jgi:xanthine dehydrogenase molybdopterin binding subunit/xanthine dehydrogenase small subunit